MDADRVASRVSHLLNVSVLADSIGNTGAVSLRVDGVDRPRGFAAVASVRLSVAHAHIAFDTLAKPLLDSVSRDEGDWQQLANTVNNLEGMGVRLEIKVDGSRAAGAPAETPGSLEISGRAVNWQDDAAEAASSLAAIVMGMLLSLLPLDDPEAETQAEPTGDAAFAEEGRKRRIATNWYERSRSNRALAIIAHGTACTSCGFSFERAYGELGIGYVEIHHLTPVHLMDGPRIVNPIEELVPLCSNCHRMVHRIDPPMPPHVLREILEAMART
ncbi:HNH endonuclease [Salinibacterium sp. ZJ454]|uniref:HNH endonuclease n=1 Tax=Salinibacterium sp. ZJ454 TaxID=2708339 RepID=UPI0014237342|nr:HNH endonuclease [Salinibacterium sp. ZJ454]